MSATPTESRQDLEERSIDSALDATLHPHVDLKSPVLVALLAWLVPGLGHRYQGRYFKAALFCLCILGTFLTGVCLGGSPLPGFFLLCRLRLRLRLLRRLLLIRDSFLALAPDRNGPRIFRGLHRIASRRGHGVLLLPLLIVFSLG